MARPRGRPPTRLRTPQQQADYRQLMAMLADLQARHRQADMQQLNAALLDLYAPKAREILINAFAGCRTLAEAYALAVAITEPTDA